MDPELKKKYEEAVNLETLNVWGPPSKEASDFLAGLEIIDMNKILGHETQLLPHYRIRGRLSLTPMLTRGLFEALNLRLTKDDVLVTSYPKCGTTWIQEIVYLVVSDCDFATAKSKILDERSPTMEYPECTFKTLQELPPPRVLKSHIPFSWLPGGDKKDYKIIYLTRNPKDVAVSMYHFYKMFPAMLFDGNVNDMLNMFLADACLYAPFHTHALEYWGHVKDSNVLFMKYEDLHKDIEKEVRRVVKFLGKNFSDEQIEGIVRATSFEEMSSQGTKNHSQWEGKQLSDSKVGKFMRKGKVGDWKLHFDTEMNKRFDEYIEQHFGNSDLKYDYE